MYKIGTIIYAIPHKCKHDNVTPFNCYQRQRGEEYWGHGNKFIVIGHENGRYKLDTPGGPAFLDECCVTNKLIKNYL